MRLYTVGYSAVEFMGRGLCRIRWYVVISNIALRSRGWEDQGRAEGREGAREEAEAGESAGTDFIRRNRSRTAAILSCLLCAATMTFNDRAFRNSELSGTAARIYKTNEREGE